MIERPASAAAGVAPAGGAGDDGGGGARQAAPEPLSSIPPIAEQAPAQETAPHVIAGRGPDPALTATARPRLADRVSAQIGAAALRTNPRHAPRASHRVESMNYRAIFACCLQATETPTE